MTESDKKSEIQVLSERLNALKKNKVDEPLLDDHYSQAHFAWRMVIELVAGLAIGFGIGWGLDYLFNSKPLFMILFILLGMAAGINVMLKTAREIGAEQVKHTSSVKKKESNFDGAD
ncbi:MAG: AtpZ/AtpI family protein [Paracoccaceae bacterium]|jgi:ATP synthase protein I|nr:AtpZ/AtpI family protein [Paracoccaceae bacterium]